MHKPCIYSYFSKFAFKKCQRVKIYVTLKQKIACFPLVKYRKSRCIHRCPSGCGPPGPNPLGPFPKVNLCDDIRQVQRLITLQRTLSMPTKLFRIVYAYVILKTSLLKLVRYDNLCYF